MIKRFAPIRNGYDLGAAPLTIYGDIAASALRRLDGTESLSTSVIGANDEMHEMGGSHQAD